LNQLSPHHTFKLFESRKKAFHGTLSIEDIGEIDQVVGQWCLARVPAHLKQSVDYDYEIDGQAVTILEVRPAWRGTPGEVTRRPIAKFRFVKVTGFWKILLDASKR
jgi:hypothetical protein